MVTQVAYGHEVDGKGDVVAFQIMPGYKITDKLEAILRYQYATASEANGISTLNRQQKTIGVFTGDTYNALYLGLDYYLYGQKFKLMFGEEYARLGGGAGSSANYNGWTTWVGFRLFF
jgi:phosphate-selective porin OprO/OprP